MEENSQLWVDKYRPKTLDEYVLDGDTKEYFKQMLEKNALQNMCFEGVQGSGKTTLARLLAEQAGAETLFVKCATEGTVDVLRSKIQEFCNAMSFDGKLKIVLLDELDSSSNSGVNSFQLGLRTLIEEAQSNCRFLCTCNYVNKVIPAVLSRCPVIPLRYDKKDLLARVRQILDSENVKYAKESLKQFIEEAFCFYPDCRRVINYLQFCCNSGELKVNLNRAAENEKTELVQDLIRRAKSGAGLMELRSFYLSKKQQIQDYKTFAGELYEYVLDNNIIKNPAAVVRMSDIIYQMNLVVNPEIQFFALLCEIAESSK